MADRSADLVAYEPIVDKDGRPLRAFTDRWQRRKNPPKYAVADLPTSSSRDQTGEWAYATDLRVFNGAGTREAAGHGTGGLVSFNGTNWVIAGTNVTAAA